MTSTAAVSATVQRTITLTFDKRAVGQQCGGTFSVAIVYYKRDPATGETRPLYSTTGLDNQCFKFKENTDIKRGGTLDIQFASLNSDNSTEITGLARKDFSFGKSYHVTIQTKANPNSSRARDIFMATIEEKEAVKASV